MRDYLSNSDSILFPRHGTLGAPAERILNYLTTFDSSKLSLNIHCSSSTPCVPTITTETNEHIPSIFFSNLWTSWSEQLHSNNYPQTANTQNWIDLCLTAKEKQINQSLFQHSPTCFTPFRTSYTYILENCSPLLTFEIAPNTIPLHVPNKKIYIKTSLLNSTQEYNLRAIIYYGSYHFTTRLFDKENNIWIYDGQKNNGFPKFDGTLLDDSNLNNLTSLEDRTGHIYIYAL